MQCHTRKEKIRRKTQPNNEINTEFFLCTLYNGHINLKIVQHLTKDVTNCNRLGHFAKNFALQKLRCLMRKMKMMMVL